MRPAPPRPPPRPPPPPGLLRGICPPCQSRGWFICKFTLPGGRAFANLAANTELLTRTRFPISSITTQRILLEKQADWLIFQGQEKLEEVGKGMFSILCMHYDFFIPYQAKTT